MGLYMNKPRILFSGLGGSLFPYLHEKLKNAYELFYVDSNERLKNLYPDFNFFPCPLVLDTEYRNFIEGIISKYDIQYYIPLIDEEILLAKRQIEGYNGVNVISPNAEFSELCLNKLNLMRKLSTLDLSVVKSFSGDKFSWEFPPPIFIKPISGRGSRGIRKIESAEQLTAYYHLEPYAPSEIIIQPFIAGTEYTVGVTTNDKNDILALSSKKVISKKGITQIAVTENNPIIEGIAIKLVELLNPGGPINIQLILTPENEVNIFEINPRFSTTTIMEYEGGLDLIELYISNLGVRYKGNINRPRQGLALHRRWENIFYETR